MMSDIRSFIPLCSVWNLEHFWHVFVNQKYPSLQDGTHIYKMLSDISVANTDAYIRFTFVSGEVIWMHNGQCKSPFEVAMFIPSDKSLTTRTAGLDISRLIISSQVSNITGFYRVELSGGSLDLDLPTLISSSSSRIVQWVKHNDLSPEGKRPGWDKLLETIPWGSRVRFYHHRKVLWLDGTHFRRKSQEKHVKEMDNFSYEYGTITPAGKLMLVRITESKSFIWANKLTHSASVLHRTNGPAKVILHNVKELYQTNDYNMSVMGTYNHEWYINGNSINHTRIDQICRQNHITLYQGPCHNRSAFLNEQDQMLWLSSVIN